MSRCGSRDACREPIPPRPLIRIESLSEFILTEFYLRLRISAVLQTPLVAPAAAAVINRYRKHPRWQILGFPPRSRELHDELWKQAAARDFARRRIYDTRTALSLVTFGFKRVWNPLAAA